MGRAQLLLLLLLPLLLLLRLQLQPQLLLLPLLPLLQPQLLLLSLRRRTGGCRGALNQGLRSPALRRCGASPSRRDLSRSSVIRTVATGLSEFPQKDKTSQREKDVVKKTRMQC